MSLYVARPPAPEPALADLRLTELELAGRGGWLLSALLQIIGLSWVFTWLLEPPQCRRFEAECQFGFRELKNTGADHCPFLHSECTLIWAVVMGVIMWFFSNLRDFKVSCLSAVARRNPPQSCG